MRRRRGNRPVAASLPFSIAGSAMDVSEVHTVLSGKHGASPRLSPGMGKHSGLSVVCGARSAPVSVILPTGGLALRAAHALFAVSPRQRAIDGILSVAGHSDRRTAPVCGNKCIARALDSIRVDGPLWLVRRQSWRLSRVALPQSRHTAEGKPEY